MERSIETISEIQDFTASRAGTGEVEMAVEDDLVLEDSQDEGGDDDDHDAGSNQQQSLPSVSLNPPPPIHNSPSRAACSKSATTTKSFAIVVPSHSTTTTTTTTNASTSRVQPKPKRVSSNTSAGSKNSGERKKKRGYMSDSSSSQEDEMVLKRAPSKRSKSISSSSTTTTNTTATATTTTSNNKEDPVDPLTDHDELAPLPLNPSKSTTTLRKKKKQRPSLTAVSSDGAGAEEIAQFVKAVEGKLSEEDSDFEVSGKGKKKAVVKKEKGGRNKKGVKKEGRSKVEKRTPRDSKASTEPSFKSAERIDDSDDSVIPAPAPAARARVSRRSSAQVSSTTGLGSGGVLPGPGPSARRTKSAPGTVGLRKRVVESDLSDLDDLDDLNVGKKEVSGGGALTGKRPRVDDSEEDGDKDLAQEDHIVVAPSKGKGKAKAKPTAKTAAKTKAPSKMKQKEELPRLSASQVEDSDDGFVAGQGGKIDDAGDEEAVLKQPVSKSSKSKPSAMTVPDSDDVNASASTVSTTTTVPDPTASTGSGPIDASGSTNSTPTTIRSGSASRRGGSGVVSRMDAVMAAAGEEDDSLMLPNGAEKGATAGEKGKRKATQVEDSDEGEEEKGNGDNTENEDPTPHAVGAPALIRKTSTSSKPKGLAGLMAKKGLLAAPRHGLSNRAKIPRLHMNLKPPPPAKPPLPKIKDRKKKGEDYSDEEKPWYETKHPEDWDSDDQREWQKHVRRKEKGWDSS